MSESENLRMIHCVCMNQFTCIYLFFFNEALYLLETILEMCQCEGLLGTSLIKRGLKVFRLANPMEDISMVHFVILSVCYPWTD